MQKRWFYFVMTDITAKLRKNEEQPAERCFLY